MQWRSDIETPSPPNSWITLREWPKAIPHIFGRRKDHSIGMGMQMGYTVIWSKHRVYMLFPSAFLSQLVRCWSSQTCDRLPYSTWRVWHRCDVSFSSTTHERTMAMRPGLVDRWVQINFTGVDSRLMRPGSHKILGDLMPPGKKVSLVNFSFQVRSRTWQR